MCVAAEFLLAQYVHHLGGEGLHSALGNLCPEQFEQQFYTIH